MNNIFSDVRFKNLSIAVLAALGLFLLVQIVVSIGEWKIKKDTIMPSNVITARAVGEVLATPDIATFSFTVREESKDVAVAQKTMADKVNEAIDLIKQSGVEEKDIKTESYYTNPKYEYSQGVCGPMYCPPSKQTIVGYEVSETVSVKVRDISKAGDLLTKIAGLSINEVSGLSMTVDDDETLKAQAKEDAIKKARADAEKTAEALGVKLGKVVGFYEEYPYGYPGEGYAENQMMKSYDVSTPPRIAPGEQKFTSTVSVTYEIK